MLVTRSNRQVGELGRLLLFAVQEQVHDTNDQDADLNEIRIRDHLHHPLLCSGGGKKFRPPPEEGASRLPNTGSASAYPCARDIIARFVEFGKMGEKPRRGESFRPPVLSLRGGAKPRRGNPSPCPVNFPRPSIQNEENMLNFTHVTCCCPRCNLRMVYFCHALR